MRIFSKFHDYYDACQGIGIYDPLIVYSREEQEVELDKYPFPYLSLPYRVGDVDLEQGVVGFCGKLYPFVAITLWDGVSYKPIYCYTYPDFDTVFQKNIKSRLYKQWTTVPRWARHRRDRDDGTMWGIRFDPQGVKDYFTLKQKPEYAKFFEQYPIFVTKYKRSFTMTYNTVLKDIQFFRVLDTFTAYQELAMWIANKAIPQKKMPLISDEDKIATHGFDKFSFRKEKAKK